MKKLIAIILALLIAALVIGAVFFWTVPVPDLPEEPELSEPSKPARPSVTEPAEPTEPEEPVDEPIEEPEPQYTTATLCVSGDIVLHQPLSDDAYARNGSYDYTYMFEHADDYIEAADYSLCCLETTFSGGANSGYPLFSSPDGVAESLAAIGMDFVSTASNHCLDTWFAGLCRTLDVLDANGLDHAGTYRTQEERDENNGIVVRDINGISVAFLAFTYGTNGLPRPDGSEFCVNIFTVDYMTNLSVINYELLRADMAAARALDTDVIAVYMHWGAEYNTGITAQQEELTDLLFAEGADIILGGHPHVPEPMELREITNEDGSTRTGFVCYCLGNFISNQYYDYTNLTAILNLELTKCLDTGVTEISACSWVPMYMLHPDASNTGDYLLLDIHRAMADYESGDTSVIGESVYAKLQTALDDLHRIISENETLK